MISRSLSFLLLLHTVLLVDPALGDITIDLSQAKIDPDTGNFCVVQKVCVANPPAELTEAGCDKLPGRCDCDPNHPDPDSQCSANSKCVDCQCLDSRCDCNNESEDPDSQCPAGNTCVDCQCLDSRCDCNPDSPNPDSQCPAGDKCVDCQCLAERCDCNPDSPNPDAQCSGGLKCVGCTCRDPKCNCDPDSNDPDMTCPNEERCVGCVCQDCPSSPKRGSGRGGSGADGRPFNPPLVFVIDTTKSVKPDQDSIFNLTKKLVDRIRDEKINIPRFQLISFNDFGPAINRNVRLEIDTDDVNKFGRKTANLKFESYDGGRDSKERLTQGLLVALQNCSPRSLIIVFTDNGSKDLGLKREIIRLKKEKETEVFIVLTPEYEGRSTGKSLPTYEEMAEVFQIKDVGSDVFLGAVEEFEESRCI